MTGRLIREFVIDLVVFLVVAMATTPFVGFVASLILPFSLFQWGLMTLAAAIFGVAIQRRVWADRLEMYRDEL
jgi:hypothetical protein